MNRFSTHAPARTWLLALFLAAAGCGGESVRSLTILHANDLHARFLPDDQGRGGFAEFATALKQQRAGSPGSIFLFGGDLVQGSPVSSIFEGLPIYEAANGLKIDVATLGNHEFDYGWRQIQEFVKAANFETVDANVVNPQGELITGKPYVIREVNGVKLGIIGLLTADLPAISRASLVGPWQAAPVAEIVRKYAREIDDQVDLVVALAHITPSEEDEILNNVPEVDLIISGHGHAGQQQVKNVDGRLCVKVRAFGHELGRLDLNINVGEDRIASYEWTRIPIGRDAFQPDPEVAAIVDKWEKKVGEAVDVKIGFATRAVRSRQELQPLIEEMMMDAVGADLAYNNPGGIRAELPPGDIRVRDVWNIEPFGNYIAYDTVKGSDLPAELTERGAIDPNKVYIVATNDFIAEKWREQGLDLTQEGPFVRDAMITWIKAKKTLP